MQNENLKNLINAIDDVLEPLQEHAADRKDIQAIAEGASSTVIDHLCKILYLKHEMPTTVHHWCTEIMAPLNRIIRTKLRSGKLNAEILADWLNNLAGQQDMTKRREHVAKQEKVDIQCCKEIEETDYAQIHQLLVSICELTIKHKYDDKQALTVKELEKLCQ